MNVVEMDESRRNVIQWFVVWWWGWSKRDKVEIVIVACIYNGREETHEPPDKSTNEIRFARDCHMTHQTLQQRRVESNKNKLACLYIIPSPSYGSSSSFCHHYPVTLHPQWHPNQHLPPAKHLHPPLPPRPQLNRRQRPARRNRPRYQLMAKRKRGRKLERKPTLHISTRVCSLLFL